jgi:hypothetical protein
MIRGRLFAALAVLALVGGCTQEKADDGSGSSRVESVTEGSSSPSPASTERAPGAVQSAWWSWAAGAPAGRNPVEDATGARCADRQPAEFWFLAGTFGGSVKRRCSVPADRTLVAPLINQIGTKKDCAAFMKSASGSFRLDGKKTDVRRWTATPVTVTGVADNPVTQVDGPLRGHGCGLWALVPPLSPGSHTASIRGSSGDFRVSADYELTVAK